MASKILVSKIAAPYADALLELAKAKDCTALIASDIRDFLDLFSSVPELGKFLCSPVIDKSKKKDLLKTIMTSKLNLITLNFLMFLIDRRRIVYFEAIGGKFLELVWKLEGIKTVNLETVIPLSYEQEEELINKLKSVTGFKEIQLVRKVSKEILGGMVIQIDSQVIDMSLKGKLKQIANILGTDFVI